MGGISEVEKPKERTLHTTHSQDRVDPGALWSHARTPRGKRRRFYCPFLKVFRGQRLYLCPIVHKVRRRVRRYCPFFASLAFLLSILCLTKRNTLRNAKRNAQVERLFLRLAGRNARASLVFRIEKWYFLVGSGGRDGQQR